MAIDRYDRVADNLGAIAATLEALRAIERHGGALILDRAFTGFTALPPPRDWRAVFGFGRDQVVTIDEVKAKWRQLSAAAHPDREGGSEQKQTELNLAWEQARRSIRTP
jgi:hypothetical protein